jgi:hypothetical protein
VVNLNLEYLKTGSVPPEDEKAVIVYYGPREKGPIVSNKNHTVYWAPGDEVEASLERLGLEGNKKIYITGLDDPDS